MDLHQRQQFDFLLQTATERFVARLEERHRGTDAALAGLARGLFAEILLLKTLEALDQNAGYQAVGPAAR